MDTFNYGYGERHASAHSVTEFRLVDDYNKPKLILLRGLPGSGKSTMAKSFESDAWVEADMYFSKTGKYVFDRDKLRHAHEWCIDTAKIMLLHGSFDVKVSNTFTTWSEIKPYVAFAVEHDYNILLYTLENNFGNVHNVPEETLYNMRQRFHSHESMERMIKEYIKCNTPAKSI